MEFNSSNGLGLFVPVFDCPLLDRQQNFKKVHEIFNRPTSCKKQYQNRAGVLGGFAGKSPHNAAGIFPKPCTCLREAASAKARRHLWKLATCVFRQNWGST